MTFGESLQFLQDLQWFGARLGLGRARQMARHFGNPEDRLRFIHVAGTNGKGSTCAMLESIYRQAGCRVGLYTSPHLVRFGERIQVNRQPIADSEVARLAAEVKKAAPGLPEPPTFFEAVTAMALHYFSAQECDLVIWETGLGGRLDATNIVTPLLSVVTNVQLDHQAWLGASLGQIAFEKAGIIKPFRPVVTGAGPGAPLDTILGVAREQQAEVIIARHPGAFSRRFGHLKIPLRGDHQWQNAAVALAVVQQLQSVIPVGDSAIEAGLQTVRWPGRFQVLEMADGRKVVLDGAHNPAGMDTLRAGLEKFFPSERFVVILGAMRDKDWASMCATIAPIASEIRVVPAGTGRGAPVVDLAAACQAANPTAAVGGHSSLASALANPTGRAIVVITGSLHLIGEATALLLPGGGREIDERGLNEWMGPAPRGSTGSPPQSLL